MRGNVLFLILIAVMLFAALTAAITKSNEGTGNMNRERGTISGTDLMSYGSAMEKTVARMLSNDMSESSLSFENGNWQFNDNSLVEPSATFPNCSSATCKVFDAMGGGMAAQTYTSQTLDSPVATDVRSGHGIVYALTVTGVGSSAQDLVLMISAIDKNTCTAINDTLKIVNPGGNPPADSWAGAVRYNGSFGSAADATGEIGDMATQIVGRTAGCIKRDSGAYGSADNYFYQVLLPR
ncbi:MAG TPA: hypothetical protein VIN59_06405 [Alphaproteobacteria bacterium]